ncbi:hypothetical protein Q1695_001632 [Nippostrongylus brasiliensis]|nr:hypothetical protein Q1695_001632 [Nippostrongylus brasiliensis]
MKSSFTTLLTAVAFVFLAISTMHVSGVFHEDFEFAGTYPRDFVSLNKKWSKLEPSIRFFKRSPLQPSFFDE